MSTTIHHWPQKMLPEKTWKLMLKSMPIPCIDVIFQNREGNILMGWRTIKPYKNMWAFPGGRVFRSETPEHAATRQAWRYGLTFDTLKLNGVFTADFGWRFDISTCFVAVNTLGTPKSDGELSRLTWFDPSSIPSRTGRMYKKMVEKMPVTGKVILR